MSARYLRGRRIIYRRRCADALSESLPQVRTEVFQSRIVQKNDDGTAGQRTSQELQCGGGIGSRRKSGKYSFVPGQLPGAGSRPRIQVMGNTTLEVQSFLLQPGGVLNEVSNGQ